MEDGDISVDAVCDLSAVAFSVVLDVADFEGDGGGVLVSGRVEEGAVAVVSVVGESHCCFLYCLCLFLFVGLCQVYRVRLFRLLRNASDTSLLLVMVFLYCLSRSASCVLLVALLIRSMMMSFSWLAILLT
ncbi:hypothetical protein [Cutibacterium phage PAVL21]|nr:hypothetical protein [Cutibacterium phage PAVL21]